MALHIEYPSTSHSFVLNDTTDMDVVVMGVKQEGVLLKATIQLQDVPAALERDGHLQNYPPHRRTLPDGTIALEGYLIAGPGQFRLVDIPGTPSLEAVIPHSYIADGLPMIIRRVDLKSFTVTGAKVEQVIARPLT